MLLEYVFTPDPVQVADETSLKKQAKAEKRAEKKQSRSIRR